MLASFFSLLLSVLLTLFALAPFYVDQTLRFLMAKEIDGVMIVITILTVATIGSLVQGLSARPWLGRWSGVVVLLVAAVWILSVCLAFWNNVEPLWQRTVPGIVFALASLWVAFLAWMPFWQLPFTNRAVIILALLFLQPFFVLRYKIQPLNAQGQFVVVKRSDLYRQMAAAPSDASPPQNPAPSPSNPVQPNAPQPKPAPVVESPSPAGWVFFSSKPDRAKIDNPSPNLVTIQIASGESTNPWDIEWAKPGISLVKDTPLDISFRAKATQPRSIHVLFQENHAPWHPIGLSQQVELTTEWKDFKFSGTASASDNNSRVTFQLGGSPDLISIADVQFTPGESGFAKKPEPAPIAPPSPIAVEPPTVDPPPTQTQTPPPPVADSAPASSAPSPLVGWTLSTAQGSVSSLTIQAGQPASLRVSVPASNPDDDWKVMLVRNDLALEKGKTYIVKVSGRANLPRSIRMVTTMTTPPWSGTGLFAPINLTTEWKESVVEFQANQTGPCRFYLALAGPEAVMDFSSIELTPKP